MTIHDTNEHVDLTNRFMFIDCIEDVIFAGLNRK